MHILTEYTTTVYGSSVSVQYYGAVELTRHSDRRMDRVWCI